MNRHLIAVRSSVSPSLGEAHLDLLSAIPICRGRLFCAPGGSFFHFFPHGFFYLHLTHLPGVSGLEGPYQRQPMRLDLLRTGQTQFKRGICQKSLFSKIFPNLSGSRTYAKAPQDRIGLTLAAATSWSDSGDMWEMR